MRGRFCTQPFLVEGSDYRPDAVLLPPRWGSRSPPHPPQCAHWGTFPQGEGFGSRNPSFRISNTFRPTDSPGRARLAEFRRPQPAEKISIIFSPGMYRGKYSSHPESAGSAGAVRGASPNFGRGLPPSRQLDTPVLCPPERRQTPGAPPKIPHSTLFSASTISKSRSFLRAVRFTAKEKTTVSTAAHR